MAPNSSDKETVMKVHFPFIHVIQDVELVVVVGAWEAVEAWGEAGEGAGVDQGGEGLQGARYGPS